MSTASPGKSAGDKLPKHVDEMQEYLKKANESFNKRWTSSNVIEVGCIDDFKLQRVIGNGAFGVVFLAVHIETSETIALKLVEKRVTVKRSQVVHLKNEIKLLFCCKCPFLVRMKYFFKDNVYLYLGMPFISGGEMFFHLKKMKRFVEPLTKFYGAQVVFAFEYLHSNGIVHRDLKPENILIGPDGYLQLCDFGFCKKIDQTRTYTLCGTPDYIAPEIILNKGHGFSVDWWSLGVLIYEMTAGYPPFYADSPIKLYEKIVAGKFRFPSHFSKAIRDLLTNMIVVDRTARYGCLKRGTLDIKGNQWFAGFDWDGVFSKKAKPPYKPTVAGDEDTSNFHEIPEEGTIRRATANEYSYAFADFNVTT